MASWHPLGTGHDRGRRDLCGILRHHAELCLYRELFRHRPYRARRHTERWAASGVFAAGATGNFPTQIYNNANYWVDVNFISGTPNPAPAFTSPGTASAAENQLVAATLTATDADNDALTYAIVGGVDAARFTVDAQTGVLSFVSAPNFEAPADAGANNVYDITVSVRDANAATVTRHWRSPSPTPTRHRRSNTRSPRRERGPSALTTKGGTSSRRTWHRPAQTVARGRDRRRNATRISVRRRCRPGSQRHLRRRPPGTPVDLPAPVSTAAGVTAELRHHAEPVSGRPRRPRRVRRQLTVS